MRREKLARTGNNLLSTLGAVEKSEERVPSFVAKVLERGARESGIGAFGIQSFCLSFPKGATKGDMERYAWIRQGRGIYMLSGTRSVPVDAPGRVVALVATVQDGDLIHMRRLHSREGEIKIRGHVVRKKLYAGGKSEHEGSVLVTPEGEYKLRRQGGNPFWDESLVPLEGKEIQCEGLLRGNQLIMTRWSVIP